MAHCLGCENPESSIYGLGGCPGCGHEAQIAALEAENDVLRHHKHDIASHCRKRGHFNSPVVHECRACIDSIHDVLRQCVEALEQGDGWVRWIKAGGGWRDGFLRWKEELDAALAAARKVMGETK